MTKTASILFLTVLLLALPAQAAGIYRGFIWGVSAQDVRQFEKAVFYEESETSLKFLELKNGYRTVIRYDFDNGKLWRVRFDYEDVYSPDRQKMFDLVMAEQQELVKQFGPPTKEYLLWDNKRYLNHPQFWRRALADGDLTITADWDLENTQVHYEASKPKGSGSYLIGYTVQDKSFAARQQAEKIHDVWNSP